eukprot:8553333-Alexandrium_andersonii.AAC.1
MVSTIAMYTVATHCRLVRARPVSKCRCAGQRAARCCGVGAHVYPIIWLSRASETQRNRLQHERAGVRCFS